MKPKHFPLKGQQYLTPSVHIGHHDAGMGAAFALGNYGTLTDDYGNVASGHRLIDHQHGQAREYHLSEAQWQKICDQVNAIAIPQHRTDNKILLPSGMDSPLETTLLELEAHGAPWTPISASEEKKLSKDFKHMSW